MILEADLESDGWKLISTEGQAPRWVPPHSSRAGESSQGPLEPISEQELICEEEPVDSGASTLGILGVAFVAGLGGLACLFLLILLLGL